MSFNQSGEAVVHRTPCAVPLATRQAPTILGYDSMLKNCYLERAGEKTYVVKRPGTLAVYTAGSGNGQGMYNYKDMLYAMNSNTLYRVTGSSSNGYAQGNAWTSAGSANFTERYAFACVVFNGQIFAIGGYNGTSTAPCSEVWSTQDGTTWNKVASSCPWTGRAFHACVVFNGKIYLTGGVDSSGAAYFNDVWSSEDGAYWERVTPNAAFAARIAFGFVALNNGMYVYGGGGAASKNDVWYSVDGANWQQLTAAASWSARTGFQYCVHNGRMWVIGGYDGGYVANTYSSQDGITWTNHTAIPVAKTQGVAVSYGDKMYVMGGISAGGPTYSNTVYSSTDGTAWTTNTAASWSARSDFGAVVFKSPTSASAINAGTIWMIAGYTGAYNRQVYYMTLDGSLPASWSISTSGSSSETWDFTTNNFGGYLIFKNTYDMYVIFAGSAIRVTDSDYPARTVPGVVTLDETTYVMDSSGTIYGSDIGNPFTWQALNFVTAEYESDPAVAIAKTQNYVVALKQNTTQFFYDTGAPFGSPLAPVSNANIRVGCVSAGSVVQMDNTLVYVAQTFQAGRSVVMLNGFSPIKISNPNIDRILDSYGFYTFYGMNIKSGGHDFYVLNLTDTNGTTLVYDFVEKEWHIWTDHNGSQWDYIFTCQVDKYSTYCQRKTGGGVDNCLTSNYQNHGNNFEVSGQTGLLDFNSTQRKFMNNITMVGDRYSSQNLVNVSWSDDNGITFSAANAVDMSLMRPRVNRGGSFRRRMLKFVHTSNNPLRLEAFEYQVTPGGL